MGTHTQGSGKVEGFPTSLAGHRFKSLEELKEHIRCLLAQAVGWMLQPEEAFFILHLCTHCPELLADVLEPIVGFKCGREQDNSDTTCFYAVCKGGTERSIDPWKCVDAIAPKGEKLLLPVKTVRFIDTDISPLTHEDVSTPRILDAWVDELEAKPVKSATPRVFTPPPDFGFDDEEPPPTRRNKPALFLDDQECFDDVPTEKQIRKLLWSHDNNAVSAWGGHLPVDGKFGPNTVKALQTYLKSQTKDFVTELDFDVDGEFGSAATRALQTFLNVHWAEAGWHPECLHVDGVFGKRTVKSLQTFLNTRWREASWRSSILFVDGKFEVSTIKALQTFLNSHWLEAGFRSGHLVVNGELDTCTVMALQILVTKHSGMCGGFGPITVKSLQNFLNIHWDKAGWRDEFLAVSGEWDVATKKALQTFLNSHWDEAAFDFKRLQCLPVDGEFGVSSIKALQTYLNNVYDSVRQSPDQFLNFVLDASASLGQDSAELKAAEAEGYTPKAVSAWSGQISVDGKSGSETIKALQTFLKKRVKDSGVVVDGEFGFATTKALQAFLNLNWEEAGLQCEKLPLDAEFGLLTIQALQTFLNARWKEAGWRATPLLVDGIYGPATIKALQTFLNMHWDEAGWRSGHLIVDGSFGPTTILALQTFLTKHFGMCGSLGPRTVMLLQTFLNTHWSECGWRDTFLDIDGQFGPDTIKALQTYLNDHWEQAGWRTKTLTVDGEFGPSSVKALQTYLNSVYDSVKSSLAPRSALKGSSFEAPSRKRPFSFFRAKSEENLLGSRKCSFSEDGPSEQTSPQWHRDYMDELRKPNWQEEAHAEAGITAVEADSPKSMFALIVGIMLSSKTWYYLIERWNSRRNCFDIILRSYEDFERLDRMLEEHFKRKLLQNSEWLNLQRIMNPEKFLEDRLDVLQRCLDNISKEKALKDHVVLQWFLGPRYLPKS